jgi:hypothetical protein
MKTRAAVVIVDRVTKPRNGGLVSISIASTGAPNGVAVGFPPRFAHRRPVKRNVSPQENMQRAAIERVRTIRTWRSHLRTHGAQVLCVCELQPGRFRKSQRVGGCGRARCWLCRPDWVQVPAGKGLATHPYRVLRLWRRQKEIRSRTRQVKRTHRIL